MAAASHRLKRDAAAGVLAFAALLLTAQMAYAACELTEAGPSECLPVAMSQTGARELTFTVGVCVGYYTWDTPAERANPLVTLIGPGGFSQEFRSNSFNNQILVAFPPTPVAVPGPGAYTLTVTTFSYTYDPAYFCYSGSTAVTVTIRDQPLTTPRPSSRPPVVTPAPATPRPTAAPTPFWPLPGIGILDPGRQVEATRQLPIRRDPAGAATGQFLETGDRATITGAPILEGGRYWYPIQADIGGWVGAGTGTDPWLIAAGATAVPSPAPTRQPGTSSTPSAHSAAGTSSGATSIPLPILAATAAGMLVLLSTAWLLFGRGQPSETPPPRLSREPESDSRESEAERE